MLKEIAVKITMTEPPVIQPPGSENDGDPCPDASTLVNYLVEPEGLSEDLFRSVTEHLQICADCRLEVNGLRQAFYSFKPTQKTGLLSWRMFLVLVILFMGLGLFGIAVHWII